MNIFVAKLNYDTQESDLQYAFEEFGAVDSAKIIMDRDTVATTVEEDINRLRLCLTV